jgi:Flp pilus assembly protein TadD
VQLGRPPKDLFAALLACALVGCASDRAPRTSSLTPDTRLQVAEAAEGAGERELAIQMYLTAAASGPQDDKLLLRCAEALTRLDKIAEARQILIDRLRETPKQPDLIRALGLLYLVAGQPAKAVAEMDKLLAQSHQDVRALVDKAVALDLLGRHGEAQRIYREVLKGAPNDPAVRNDLALSLMLEGKIQEAEAQLAPVADLGSVPQRIKVNLGLLYAATGDVAKSRELLGNRVSDSELSMLTRAIKAPAARRDNAN